jgi:hypothetical protein
VLALVAGWVAGWVGVLVVAGLVAGVVAGVVGVLVVGAVGWVGAWEVGAKAMVVLVVAGMAAAGVG